MNAFTLGWRCWHDPSLIPQCIEYCDGTDIVLRNLFRGFVRAMNGEPQEMAPRPDTFHSNR